MEFFKRGGTGSTKKFATKFATKFWGALGLLLLAGAAFGADLITATITVTNTAGTTNGQTITVNSDVRTWTNSVVIPGSQILTNSTIGGAATNLYSQIATSPIGVLALSRYGTNGITLRGSPGGALAVTLSAGWGTVVLTTNTTTPAVAVRIPYDVESAEQQTNIVSGLVRALNSAVTTNSLFENSRSVSNLVGITNNQIVRGIKLFTNVASEFYGYVSNATLISGNVYMLTNGVYWSPILTGPTLTNGVNYGNPFRSPGSAAASEQFGTSAAASGESAVAFGNGAIASAPFGTAIGADSSAGEYLSTALGDSAAATKDGSVAIGATAAAGGTNSIVIGRGALSLNNDSVALGVSATTTADNQVRLGTASEHVSVPGNLAVAGNTEIHWLRYPITSLANGNNAAVAVGTNTFIEVSGPSGAFTINGIANGSNGKFLIVLNQTGQNMTVAHESGTDPTAANRIVSMTGADRATTGNGAAMLIYSGAASRWILISLDQ